MNALQSQHWLVIGSEGFLGKHFSSRLPHAGRMGRTECNLLSPQLPKSLSSFRYAIIAAGITNPKKCAENPELSWQCNVLAPLHIGKELLKRGILPIFFSSDYVFNDQLQIAPLNLYGEQKRRLEQEGEHMGGLVIRLSKVYGIERGDGTLFDEMVAHLVARRPIRAAFDQTFSPIYVGDVVDLVVEQALQGARGIVSLAGPHYASRWEMAHRVAIRLGLSSDWIHTISLEDVQDGVQRPKKLALKGEFPARHWEWGVEQVVRAYGQ